MIQKKILKLNLLFIFTIVNSVYLFLADISEFISIHNKVYFANSLKLIRQKYFVTQHNYVKLSVCTCIVI